MTTQEIIIPLLQSFTQIIIFGVAAYWIQKQIDKSSQKRLEEFKATLTLLNSKSTKLHEKRFLVIEELYSKLVDLEISMQRLTTPLKFTADYEKNEIKLLNESDNNFQDFNLYFEKNKIYFTDSTCKEIEGIRKIIYEAILGYNEHRLFDKDEVDREFFLTSRKKMITAYNAVKDDIPILKSNIEIQFRNIMLVD